MVGTAGAVDTADNIRATDPAEMSLAAGMADTTGGQSQATHHNTTSSCPHVLEMDSFAVFVSKYNSNHSTAVPHAQVPFGI